jgi:predicted DNA-binding transcriptional regulator AlpA
MEVFMLADDESPFLTIDETAVLLRIKRGTLDNLRWSGDGPPARRHGGRIVYHRREVLDWSERRRTRTPRPGEGGKPPARHQVDARPRSVGDGHATSKRAVPPMERKPKRSGGAL